eukprot:gene6294-10300_t
MTNDNQKHKLYKEIREKYIVENSDNFISLNLTEPTSEQRLSNQIGLEHDTVIDMIETEIKSTLRFLFSRLIETKDWIDYTTSTYTLDKKSLFEEDFKEVVTKKQLNLFSDVQLLKVKKVETQKYFCVKKIVSKEKMISNLRTKISENEKKYFQEVHENVLNIIDIYDEISERKITERELFLVVEELNSTLKSYIDNSDNSTVSESEIIQYACQITSGLCYLHNQKFSFPPGKLTASRIYFNETCTELLIDPGILNTFDLDEVEIYPPNHDEIHQEKDDIFSLGIILLRLTTGISHNDLLDMFLDLNQPVLVKIDEHKKQKKRFSLFRSISTDNEFGTDQNIGPGIPQYYTDCQMLLQDKEINEGFKKLILDTLNYYGSNRPTTSKLLEKLKKLETQMIKQEDELSMLLAKENKEKRLEEERLQTIEDSFQIHRFMKNKKYRVLFKKFLEMEYAIENINFIEEVENFKTLKSSEQRYKRSNELYHLFLELNSKYELNISSSIRIVLKSELEQFDETNCPVNLFDGIVNEVIICCLSDSYARFKSTEDFKMLYSKAKRKSTNSISGLISLLLNTE